MQGAGAQALATLQPAAHDYKQDERNIPTASVEPSSGPTAHSALGW